MILKLALFVYIFTTLIGAFVISRSRWGARIDINERLFVGVSVLGVLTGVAGLAATLWLPSEILKEHIYEVILMPIYTVSLYVWVAVRARGEDKVFDEKQIHDMTHAAALSFAASWIIVLVLYLVYRAEMMSGTIFLPIYQFSSLAFFSGSVVLIYRRA